MHFAHILVWKQPENSFVWSENFADFLRNKCCNFIKAKNITEELSES